MTPDQFKTAGIRLYGRKHWKAHMARALAVDVSTIHRICKRLEVPGPYEVAVKGLLENKKAMDAAAATARKLGLVPRKRRKKVLAPRPAKRSEDGKPPKKLIPYAGSEEITSEDV